MKSPFRTIRQKLFSEGKLVRYLGYAVGEIALIIVGIFFALQLNNWNEDRKAQAEFELYVTHLREDVRQAIDNVASSKSIMETFIIRGEYVLAFLERTEYNPEELAAFEEGLNSLSSVNQPQVYVGLLGQFLNGDTNTIGRNQDLAQEALKMESEVEMSLANIQRNGNQSELVAANYLSFLVGIGNNTVEVPPRYNLKLLRSSDEFKNGVYSIQGYKRRMIFFDDIITENLESFLAVLEEYE